MNLSQIIRLLSAITLLFFPFYLVANAIELQKAKDNHLVGETLSGYIEVVMPTYGYQSSFPEKTDIDQFVRSINDKRKKSYQIIADNNHISVEIVANIAGQKLVKNVKPGHYAKGINGQWKLF